MDEQKVLILSGLHDVLKSIQGLLQVITHLFKERKRVLYKSLISYGAQILFSRQVVFIDLIRLFQ